MGASRGLRRAQRGSVWMFALLASASCSDNSGVGMQPVGAGTSSVAGASAAGTSSAGGSAGADASPSMGTGGSGGMDVSAAGNGGAGASGRDASGSGGVGASGGGGERNTSGSGGTSGAGSGSSGTGTGGTAGTGKAGAGGTGASGTGVSGTGAGGMGASGSGGSSADASCNTDDDCTLCTTALNDLMPCCPGCPTVMSKAQCEEASTTSKPCTGDPVPCPAILCVNPGTPKCQNNTCVRADGLGPMLDPDCSACTRVKNPATCSDAEPVQWECFSGFPSKDVIDTCTDLATAIPRYCCPESIGASCGDF